MVSIIMPVFNAEKWVEQAIESVKKQTYTNWELIIVNEGSSDNTQHICEQYSNDDSRISVYFQDNKGPGAARNLGLTKIQGDYFTMIDSDDCLVEAALETYVKAIKAEKADVVVAGYKMEDANQKSARFFCSEESFRIESNGNLNTKEFESVLQKGLMASNWNKLYSNKLSNLRFREDLFLNEDVLFSLMAASSAQNICVISDVVYLYKNQNNDSVSTKFDKGYFESLEFIKNTLENNQDKTLLIGIKRWIMDYMFNYLKLCCINNNSNEKVISLLKEAKKSEVYKNFGTIKVADTKNRKLSILLLKVNAFNTYIKLMKRKGI